MSTLGTQPTMSRSSGNKGTEQDFVILCPAEELGAALSALYYLPRNYKLLVRNQADESLASMLQDDAYMNRVSFEEQTGLPSTGASSSFSAVLQNSDEDFVEQETRRISLREAASPEALASAILKAARA